MDSWPEYNDQHIEQFTIGGNETISPQLLEIQTPTTNGFILDILKNTSASTFNLYSLLNMAPTNQPTYLQFGDERLKIVCDMKSFLYLCGTELDFSDGLNGKGFNFINPNASRTCGCGESFSI